MIELLRIYFKITPYYYSATKKRICLHNNFDYDPHMKMRKLLCGNSLLEVLISLSLFSIFALQTLAFCLKLHNLTRQSLYDTKAVIQAQSNYHTQQLSHEINPSA